MSSFNVMVIGKVSSGKSSFINSLTGSLVSCVSLNRETFRPILYTLTTKGTTKNAWTLSEQLDTKHESNKKHRNDLSLNKLAIDNDIDKSVSELSIPTIFKHDMQLHDFPGMCDADDKENVFDKAIERYIDIIDIVIFIVDASRAFIDKEELEVFKRLQTLIDNNKKNGHYTYYCVVVNKYDDIVDSDLEEIFNGIEKKISCKNIFRYSSHCVLTSQITKTGLYVPKYMYAEVKKILTNGLINIDDKLNYKLRKTKTMTNIESLYFKPTQFVHNSTGQELMTTVSRLGDWDDLVGAMNDVCKDINVNRLNVLKNYVFTGDADKDYKNMDREIKVLKNNGINVDDVYGNIQTYLESSKTTYEYTNRFNKLNSKLFIRILFKKYMVYITNHTNTCVSIIKTFIDGYNKYNYDTKELYDYIITILKDSNVTEDIVYGLCEYNKQILQPYVVDRIYQNVLTWSKSSWYSYSKEWHIYTVFFKQQQVNAILAHLCEYKKDDVKSYCSTLFPKYTNLIRIAEIPHKQLFILHQLDAFRELDKLYQLRITKFIIKNNDKDSKLGSQLFNDSLISQKDFDETVVLMVTNPFK